MEKSEGIIIEEYFLKSKIKEELERLKNEMITSNSIEEFSKRRYAYDILLKLLK